MSPLLPPQSLKALPTASRTDAAVAPLSTELSDVLGPAEAAALLRGAWEEAGRWVRLHGPSV
jgi:hypothetical protein